MEINLVLSFTSYLTMLPILAAVLFIVFMHKPEFLAKCGFGKPEVGMVLIGSLFGLFADIPIIVSGRSLLNVNLGGALIPLIISLNLIYKKKLHLSRIIVGTVVVAWAAYHYSTYVPNMGIVSKFPMYLVPSILSILLSLILTRGYQRVSYAYSVSVLGVLIGADIVRIPMLLEDGVLGSIGGGGAMDLVYLSGLLAAVPIISFYYFDEPYSKDIHILDTSKKLLGVGRYKESLHYNIIALERELKKVKNILNRRTLSSKENISFDSTQILKYLRIHPYIIRDYNRLRNMKGVIDKKIAKKSFITTQLLLQMIQMRINDHHSRLGRRVLAYMIDLLILFLPFFLFFLFLPRFSFLRENISFPVLVAVISLTISIQFIYFTLLEWSFGTTIGKNIFGLKVLSDDMDDINFIQSTARNSGRYADILLMFYIFSFVLILKSPEDKRIGDAIADTRVVKI